MATLAKGCHGRNHAIWSGGKSRHFSDRPLYFRHLLAGVTFQGWLVLESIYLTDTAFEKQKDTALSFGGELLRLGCQKPGRDSCRTRLRHQQIHACQASEAQIRTEEQLPSRQQILGIPCFHGEPPSLNVHEFVRVEYDSAKRFQRSLERRHALCLAGIRRPIEYDFE